MNVYNGPFWKATLERTFFTFLETYFGIFLVGDVLLNAFEFDWVFNLGPALGAAILAVIKSLFAAKVNHPGSPSFANEAVVQLGRHARPE